MFDRRENEHYDYPQLSIFRNKQTILNRELLISSAIDRNDTMLYIHIPFCGNECIFCNYYKTTMSHRILEEYFNCMQKEIAYYAKLLPPSCKKLAGIHFGGGTPSIVPIRFYNKLLEHISSFFDISNCQISFEGNVLSLLQKQYIEGLRNQGINRVSFGVQTLNQELRLKYGLFTDTPKISKVIYSLKENGILDVNTDLMFNFPNQTIENVLDDVYTLFEMDVNCIDLYSLIVFPNTNMHKKLVEGGDWAQYSDKKQLSSFNSCFLELTHDDSVHFIMSNTITKNKHYQNVNLSIMLGNNQLNGGNVIGIGASSRGYINKYIQIQKLCKYQ